MIKVTKEQWAKIPKDYKGKWTEDSFRNDIPTEFIGRRTVMSGCISDEQGALLTEGVHFEIID